MSRRTSSWQEKTILVSLILSSILLSGSRGSRLFPILSGTFPEVSSDLNISNNENSNNNSNTENYEGEDNANGTMRCDDARLRCAYRRGCGNALQHYLTRCASVLQGDINECPEICQHALIALTSTDEGKELMKCECTKGDTLCELSKQRAEICRSPVTTTMNRTRVSCRVATWICNADAICQTALQYYNENCKRMFHGKKCTKRCRNSLSILRRQEKAAKLNTCFCDGAEELECISIHRNMNNLCFGNNVHRDYHQENTDFNNKTNNNNNNNSNQFINSNYINDNNQSIISVPAKYLLLLCLVLHLFKKG